MIKSLSGGVIRRDNVKNTYAVDMIEFDKELTEGSKAVLYLVRPMPQSDPEFKVGEQLDFDYSNNHEKRTFVITTVYGPCKLGVKQRL